MLQQSGQLGPLAVKRLNLLVFVGGSLPFPNVILARCCQHLPQIMTALPFVPGYEANEDKVHTEPLPTDPDEPPPAPVMLAEPASVAPVAPVSLDCSKMAYTEYSEPGQLTRTGSSSHPNVCVDSILL